MAVRRTYWHLASLGTKPTDYDIATSRLLYYPARGFEVTTPLSAWYRDYQTGSPLRADDWDAFRDPRETTYASYVELQRAKEAFVDGILASGRSLPPSPTWRDTLSRVLPAVRFPIHGLHMIAAYIGSMAPSGRIAIACAFQAADEVRRIQRFAYRMRELELVDHGRDHWEREPAWQPLRELVEKLLATRDWGEAFVALVLVKTRFDDLFGTRFGELAHTSGDDVLANILYSLGEDASWHAAWTGELLRFATGNDAAIATWHERWQPLVARAFDTVAEVLR
jgi:toluene monooxygenase system protein E